MVGVVLVACAPAPSPARAPSQSELSVDEIEGGVTPPDSRVVDATGGARRDANPEALRAAGDYFYRSGEFSRAREFYAACSGGADDEPLRAACQWGLGATLVATARQQVDEDLARAQALGLQPTRGLHACTRAADELRHALVVLRVAHRVQPTARRAGIIAALYEELGSDAEALSFYERALILDPDDPKLPRAIARLRSHAPLATCRSCLECRPRDCRALPFGWHRRSEELEVLGSGIEGSSKARIFDCHGEPASFSSDTWTYSQTTCTSPSVVISLRLHFEDDVVDHVTHERALAAHDCSASAR